MSIYLVSILSILASHSRDLINIQKQILRILPNSEKYKKETFRALWISFRALRDVNLFTENVFI